MAGWRDLQLSRRGIALDPSTGESFRLNETASFILSSLQRDLSEQETAKNLTIAYDIAYELALSDVYEFVANLNIQGIGQ